MENTTLKARRSAANFDDELVLALRWVFPVTDGRLTVLGGARPLFLGRGQEADVRLPSDEISRRHAEIRRQGAVMVIRDCGSTNGVLVDGRRVTEAPLTPGRVLRLGDWIGIVVQASARDEEVEEAFGDLGGGYLAGPVLRPLLAPVRRAARADLPVLIEGETGTGKEGAARAVHAWSGRSGPFLAINCAALPEALAEGELFGYRRGAFTGAERNHPGLFRAADGGTLFLDEIVDLPPALQAKLLRVVEQREVLPLGEAQPVPVDVRLVAAAQMPLGKAVEERRFRGDLFARLDGVAVILPPLRERVQEIPFLFLRLLERNTPAPPPVDPGLVEQLCLYDWPFNVRELDLLARKLLAIHGDEPILRRSHLPERMRGARRSGASTVEGVSAPGAASEVMLEELLASLRANDGNVARAAAALGISRQKAYRLMETQDGESRRGR